MHLYKVYIYSNMSAQKAQDKINAMIEEYAGYKEDYTVNFDLQVENSVAAGNFIETRYTLVIYIYSLEMEIGYADS